jgi:O-acetyl-ADP-ribose deacetylase (regulator of RNase III)
MSQLKVILTDSNESLFHAWKSEFANINDVTIKNISIFDIEADAIISPANSFGIMDGGLDGKLRDYFGSFVEKSVIMKIKENYNGELPVGCAIITNTNNTKFPFLVSAPTMRVPEEVSNTINAYLAMKAILICLVQNNIKSAAIPGLCSLSGRMPYNIVARQMRCAYEKIILGKYDYSHWREEKALQRYLKCEVPYPPEDLSLYN